MSKTVIPSSLSATGCPHRCSHGNDRPTNSSRVSAGCAEIYLYDGKPPVNPVVEGRRPDISISETCECDRLFGASVIKHRPWYAGETCCSLNIESLLLNERLELWSMLELLTMPDCVSKTCAINRSSHTLNCHRHSCSALLATLSWLYFQLVNKSCDEILYLKYDAYKLALWSARVGQPEMSEWIRVTVLVPQQEVKSMLVYIPLHQYIASEWALCIWMP
jgi:hypothetical protein